MEIEFLHENLTGKDPKLLMDHIQRMASGEAPFFATTLSSVYSKLIEKAFAQSTPSSSGFVKSIQVHNAVVPSPPIQASTSTPGIPSPFTFSFRSSPTVNIPPPPIPNIPSSSTPNIPSSSTLNIPSSSTFGVTLRSHLRATGPSPQPQPAPSTTASQLVRLECQKCGQTARLKDVRDCRCPVCPRKSKSKGPHMKCQSCNAIQTVFRNDCVRKTCRKKFM